MADLDGLLKKMVASNASDLHLSCKEPVRMRISGELRRVGNKALGRKQLSGLMQGLCRDDQWKRYLAEKDLDFAYGITGVSRFRCNYFTHFDGPAAVFRRIPETIVPINKLGMPPVVSKLAELKRGLVLVTGPTGSGKSTTLAGIINRINRKVSKHIITIEDPIEFVHKNEQSFIVQREVGHHTNSFSEALADALQEDPDVILVGELRDLETMALAISAAEMGVLVFGTLHTNSAPKTIDRLVDSFPMKQRDQVRGMLAESLQAIVAQQLLKRVDTGGRIAAVEILLRGAGMSNIIREGSVAKLQSFMESGKGQGMQFLDSSLIKLVQQGIVSSEDAFMKASDKQRFEQWLDKLEK